MPDGGSKCTIHRVVILGDSLTDRGILDKRHLFGVIPMSWLAGLSSKSPRGRFTNGYAWADHVSAQLCEQALRSDEASHQ